MMPQAPGSPDDVPGPSKMGTHRIGDRDRVSISYPRFSCASTLYSLILTTSYPVRPLSTPSYGVFYCPPTLDSTPSYLILPHLTTSYPFAPSYPILQCSLLPSYLTSNPVLLYPTPYKHILPRPTLESPAILPCPTPSNHI